MKYFMGYDEDGHPFLFNLSTELHQIRHLLNSDGMLNDACANEDIDPMSAVIEDLEILSQRGGPSIFTKD